MIFWDPHTANMWPGCGYFIFSKFIAVFACRISQIIIHGKFAQKFISIFYYIKHFFSRSYTPLNTSFIFRSLKVNHTSYYLLAIFHPNVHRHNSFFLSLLMYSLGCVSQCLWKFISQAKAGAAVTQYGDHRLKLVQQGQRRINSSNAIWPDPLAVKPSFMCAGRSANNIFMVFGGVGFLP